METDRAPIIVTLQFDEPAATFFETQRRTYFPAAINRVPAHLTLFHALPGAEEDPVMRAIGTVAARPRFPVAVEGLLSLGRGVAYRLSSAPLVALRSDLAKRFDPWLTRQDREAFRPHVTVQNKVTPETARATRAELERTFTPFTATAEGLQLWHYRGGPWAPLAAVAFGRR
ncbi:phosphoesterase HXTX [Acuticoccus sediminis]|uniref:Phosphoesterase HXTX n=1 Tax=Acuticoccus sediminis TaxID=2184697 RepID=A0A8B2NS36_9HYPH|nr:2'-5' RNA ligase family protein [Acuticoccus sediminis]RAI00879.1 phosphoesterase HXTX [Acuticoccus sediminis]